MDKDQIKEFLLNNVDKIEDILEDIGCNHIKTIKDKRVQCSLPDGDNPTSLQIFLNNCLNAKIYTRNEFENYEIKDLYSAIQFIKECSLNEAINIICKVCDIQYSYSNKKELRSSSYDFLKQYKRSIKKEEYVEEEIVLPESFLGRFVREDCSLFLDDGVDSAAQSKFNVSYCVLEDRVVFPIRSDEGKLLSFKGRINTKDWKTLGLNKFISYYPCSNNNYLFGLYENYFDIIGTDEIFITEAEKGTMQLSSMGINNAVAINKKIISDIQVKKLLKLGKSIVLCLDKDVSKEEVLMELKKFSGLCRTFYIFDTLNLLKPKQSPVDCGREVWDELNENCKFEYINN